MVNFMNLYNSFISTCDRYAEKVAVEYLGKSYRYCDLLTGAHQVGKYIKSKNGDIAENIGILSGNGPAFIFSFYGCLSVSKVCVPMNYLQKPSELAYIAKDSDMRFLLVAEQFLELAKLVANMYPSLNIVCIEDIIADRVGTTLVPSQQSNGKAAGDLPRSTDDTAVIIYTSGTTGKPKGVMLTHKNIISNYLACREVLKYTPEQTMIEFLPSFHSYALTLVYMMTLNTGASFFILPKFIPNSILDAIARLDKPAIAAIPSMYNLLAKTAKTNNSLKGKLTLALSGAAPMPTSVQELFESKFEVEILEGYGLTEASPVVCTNRPGMNKRGTVGPPLPNLTISVKDEQGNLLPANIPGELFVKGDSIMKGYYKKNDETKTVINPNGELRTGDLVQIDNDGYVKIVGRKKEMLICGGENVYPLEIEELLYNYTGVYEAAVIGVQDELKGEVPYAFIVPEQNRQLDIAELRKYCANSLPVYKIPKYIKMIPEMPKNPTGKIKKDELRLLVENTTL